jgi:heme exporter protein C
MNQRMFVVVGAAAVLMFAFAPLMIAWAPYESTMGLVQKVFYFHVPAWFVMFLAIFVSGIASAVHLAKDRPAADRLALSAAELATLFGAIGLITGPLWARKSWGVWWQWDARLTMAIILELIFVAYLLLRKYGGAGSDKLAAGLALFGMANVPFLYISVNVWRTIHPRTSVVPTLGPGMFGAFWWCVAAFLLLFVVVVAARTRLEEQRARVDDLHLALEDY